jgi:hypothetical protein
LIKILKKTKLMKKAPKQAPERDSVFVYLMTKQIQEVQAHQATLLTA